MAFKRRSPHLRLGIRGERIARRVLERSGMEFLTANFRCYQGEIDLIFREENLLCFVEVKTRHRSRFAPATAVTYEKQKRIARAARRYMRVHNLRNVPIRCDIVEVVFDGNQLSEVHHLKNSFKIHRF